MGDVLSFGIDFGTTNSAAFSFNDTGKLFKETSYGTIGYNRPFPSIVAINKKDGTLLTDIEARERRNELESDYEVIKSVKTVIDKDRTYEIAGKKWTPVEIAAEIFKGLAAAIKHKAKIECKSAIVAVPVGFSPAKKANIRKAAKIAGIEVLQFISEPTAAFCSNYEELKMCTNVAVFDWGGGTLDVAVLHIENGKVYELESDRMDIGGDDIDEKIARKMHERFCEDKKINLSFDEISSKARDSIICKCEAAKIDLTDTDVSSISMLQYDNLGIVRASIDYDYFSLLIEPEVEMAMECLENAINKSGLNITNIDRILCVGGSSKLRPLRRKLIKKYGKGLVYYPKSVMWDIARGAALINTKGYQYRLNQDLGLVMSNGDFYPMLRKGQTLPCEEARMCFATVNNEKVAKFIVSDSANPDECSFQQYITVEMEKPSFLKSYFEVSCFIDPDMLFRLRIRSSEFQHKYMYIWTYDNVKLVYRLEGGGKNG